MSAQHFNVFWRSVVSSGSAARQLLGDALLADFERRDEQGQIRVQKEGFQFDQPFLSCVTRGVSLIKQESQTLVPSFSVKSR